MKRLPGLNRRQFRVGSLTSSVLGLRPSFGWVHGGTYPTKPVRIVVSQAAGGSTELWARHFAEQLTQQFGKVTVVENKTGAGGVIGIDSVAKPAPDGYTVRFSATSTVMQNRVLFTKLPYNVDKDLLPVAVYPSGPLVLASAPSTPVKTVEELPGWGEGRALSMGSWAPGSYAQMIAGLLTGNYGMKIQTVNYRGETLAWVDLASGQVEIGMGSVTGHQTSSNRGVKAIGVTCPYHSPRLPEVPTMRQHGIGETLVALEGGSALMVPAATPEAIMKVLSDGVVKATATEHAGKLR